MNSNFNPITANRLATDDVQKEIDALKQRSASAQAVPRAQAAAGDTKGADSVLAEVKKDISKSKNPRLGALPNLNMKNALLRRLGWSSEVFSQQVRDTVPRVNGQSVFTDEFIDQENKIGSAA